MIESLSSGKHLALKLLIPILFAIVEAALELSPVSKILSISILFKFLMGSIASARNVSDKAMKPLATLLIET